MNKLAASRELRSVLMIAFHFPPVQGSSGWQRCLRFAQHLPDFGWRPVILTVSPTAYEARSTGADSELPPGLEVHRAFGLDAARHLSFRGHYPRFLALPDRWASWRYRAVVMGRRLVRERAIDVLWSTFPIATAHEIGLKLSRQTRLPWVAEFRDPMWQGDYPPDPAVNAYWRDLEQQIFREAATTVVTTPGAARTYATRFGVSGYPKPVVIENGYDEQTFYQAEQRLGSVLYTGAGRGPRVILHSGIVYRSERDPTHLFAALAMLKASGRISSRDLRIVFRACGDEAGYRRDVESLGIADIVSIEPAIAYSAALEEMLSVDALLLLQAANCNDQVPAKLYEYLRAGRPILALTDPHGDTAAVLRAAGTGLICPLDSAQDICCAVLQLLGQLDRGDWQRPTSHALFAASRRERTRQLAGLLDSLMDGKSAGAGSIRW